MFLKRVLLCFFCPVLPVAPIEIANKTAAFVARNNESGTRLEERLRQTQKNDARFCFLNPADPFHAYYAFKVQEAKSSIDQGIKSSEGASDTQDNGSVPEAQLNLSGGVLDNFIHKLSVFFFSLCSFWKGRGRAR